jgi:hypothetical protein
MKQGLSLVCPEPVLSTPCLHFGNSQTQITTVSLADASPDEVLTCQVLQVGRDHSSQKCLTFHQINHFKQRILRC